MPARFVGARLLVATLRADEVARPGRERGELDFVLLVRLLDAGGAQVVEDHRGEVLRRAVLRCGLADHVVSGVDQLVVLVDAEHAVGREALDRERPGHTDRVAVLVGLVVEVLELGLGRDRGVDLALPGDAQLPPVGVALLAKSGQLGSASRGISHSSHDSPSSALSISRDGSSCSW